jgi:hypothetical protein
MNSLQGFKDAEELAMISKQRMTRTPGPVFDISQFKLAVDQDVSTDVIEKLQAEFGQDMAGGKNCAPTPSNCFSRTNSAHRQPLTNFSIRSRSQRTELPMWARMKLRKRAEKGILK